MHDRKVIMSKRLERCKTCTKPTEGENGCSGNQGLGCMGDWRCCREIEEVCKDCTSHNKSSCWMCENTDCKKMKQYFEK